MNNEGPKPCTATPPGTIETYPSDLANAVKGKGRDWTMWNAPDGRALRRSMERQTRRGRLRPAKEKTGPKGFAKEAGS